MPQVPNALSFGDFGGEKEEAGDGFISLWLERRLITWLSMQVLCFLDVFKRERNDPQREYFI